MILESLVESATLLGHIVLVWGFSYLIAGLVGVELFGGQLRGRYVPLSLLAENDRKGVCSLFSGGWGGRVDYHLISLPWTVCVDGRRSWHSCFSQAYGTIIQPVTFCNPDTRGIATCDVDAFCNVRVRPPLHCWSSCLCILPTCARAVAGWRLRLTLLFLLTLGLLGCNSRRLATPTMAS